MDVEEQDLWVMELKYCERCGGLWLRRQGNEEVYCRGCRQLMARLPMGRKGNRRCTEDSHPEMETARCGGGVA